jgi:hypothetical protein
MKATAVMQPAEREPIKGNIDLSNSFPYTSSLGQGQPGAVTADCTEFEFASPSPIVFRGQMELENGGFQEADTRYSQSTNSTE